MAGNLMPEFKVCGMKAFVKYTWPGQKPTTACLVHATQVAKLANAMGFKVDMLPIYEVDHQETCQHEVNPVES